MNGADAVASDFSPNETLLDYLRLKRRLTGTKEGCAEGDCGACTVLVGRLKRGRLVYETVNSCIRLLASLDGCHVVTVEHLSAGRALHPVQEAMVRTHGSQCGFCTPGIVMSLYALWMENPKSCSDDVEKALQGNLCRCTGYAPIIRAAQSVVGDPSKDLLVIERDAVKSRLETLMDGHRVEIEHAEGISILPASVADLGEILNDHKDATIIAGATDVGLWVTKFMRPISPAVHISHVHELHDIKESSEGISIGAGVSYSEFADVIARHFPQVEPFWARIGGEQVRNMGTIGGNIANGSPIGDTPPMLIALGASITLQDRRNSREMLLEDFFVDYGKQDLKAGEFLQSIRIPLPREEDIFEVRKISKRKDEDISSVCGAFWLRLREGVIEDARVAFGGMAAIPKRAKEVETSLIGQPWSLETIEHAQLSFEADFAPISDMRASAQYRALVARNLLKRVYLDHALKSETVA